MKRDSPGLQAARQAAGAISLRGDRDGVAVRDVSYAGLVLSVSTRKHVVVIDPSARLHPGQGAAGLLDDGVAAAKRHDRDQAAVGRQVGERRTLDREGAGRGPSPG